MKLADLKSSTYIDFNKENKKEDPKFGVADYVTISKHKNIFVKSYTPNWSKEVFMIQKVKSAVSGTYVISDLNCEEIFGTFFEKELQKTNQKGFRVEKVIKRKGDKKYVKWEGYDYYLNIWIVKKRQCK